MVAGGGKKEVGRTAVPAKNEVGGGSFVCATGLRVLEKRNCEKTKGNAQAGDRTRNLPVSSRTLYPCAIEEMSTDG